MDQVNSFTISCSQSGRSAKIQRDSDSERDCQSQESTGSTENTMEPGDVDSVPATPPTQSYITAPTELNAYVRALNQAVFEKGHWNFDIQIFKNMVSACNQAGGSKRKNTYHEGRNADVDTSTVTNLHRICAGLKTNHNLLNASSVMIGHRISDKALTLALQSQRQEELNDNGGVSAIGDHLSNLINLQLINYDQVVAAVSIFESSTIAASLFLKTKDVLEQARLVKKMVDRQAKHGKN